MEAVSIHAPAIRRDHVAQIGNAEQHAVSIHAPAIRRDGRAWRARVIYQTFQSTRPRLGATRRWPSSMAWRWSFNPRARD